MSNTLPQMRVNLRNLSSNNQSLQDIIKSCTMATEVVSVEPYSGKIHNTKMILRIDKGVKAPVQERYIERVVFYKRLDIAEILLDADYSTSNEGGIDGIINQLNNLGFDFTTDDVELVGGNLKAKIYSLGYFNKSVEGSVCTPTTFSWDPLADPIEVQFDKPYVVSYILTLDNVITERGRIVTQFPPQTAGDIAKELFLYSGIDLMRQHNMDTYFNYTPANDVNYAGEPITIVGIDENSQLGNDEIFSPKSVKLQLVPINTFDMRVYGQGQDLMFTDSNAYVDYVQEQFGGEVLLHSCGEKIYTGEG